MSERKKRKGKRKEKKLQTGKQPMYKSTPLTLPQPTKVWLGRVNCLGLFHLLSDFKRKVEVKPGEKVREWCLWEICKREKEKKKEKRKTRKGKRLKGKKKPEKKGGTKMPLKQQFPQPTANPATRFKFFILVLLTLAFCAKRDKSGVFE